jgi:hypothetical protein
MGHYDIVYAYASDMAHSSPRGVLSTFKGANVADWRTFLAKMDESERREVLTVTSLSVLFACEVVALTKFLDRAFDPVKMLLVMERVYQLYGVQPPENRPEIAAAMRAHSAKDRKP